MLYVYSFSCSDMSLNFLIGLGFGLMPPQNKSNFDNKTKITSSINISKSYINNEDIVCL